jgi:hypothetical protein
MLLAILFGVMVIMVLATVIITNAWFGCELIANALDMIAVGEVLKGCLLLVGGFLGTAVIITVVTYMTFNLPAMILWVKALT